MGKNNNFVFAALFLTLILYLGIVFAALQTEPYGTFLDGKSKYIFVAPHARDEPKTEQIAVELALRFNGTAISNNVFTRFDDGTDYVEDFNKLSWSSSQQLYLWRTKKPEMKKFYFDIRGAAQKIKRSKEKPVIVFIHGLSEESDVGFDIGFGAKEDNGTIFSSTGIGPYPAYPEAYPNSGVIRADVEKMKKLRILLNESLIGSGLTSEIGYFYPAWSRTNGIQFDYGSNEEVFQIEISSDLRKNSTVQGTIDMIGDKLSEI